MGHKSYCLQCNEFARMVNYVRKIIGENSQIKKACLQFFGGNLTTDMWLNEEGKRKIN